MLKKSNLNFALVPVMMCWIAYTSAYMGRYSYSANINQIIDAFNLSHSEAGLVATFFYFAYSAGQVLSGILCKKYNKRLAVSLSLCASGVINFAIYSQVPFSCFKYLWLINGICQSVLWPTILCTLSENLSTEDLSGSVIIMSTSLSVGTLVTYGLSSLFAIISNYRYSFFTGAIAMLVTGIAWFVFYPAVFKEGYKAIKQSESSFKKPKLDKSLFLIISILAFFAIICNLVKDGLCTWVPSILNESFGLSNSLSILLTLFLPILGIFGAIINSFMRKKTKSFVWMCGIWYLLSAAFGLIVIGFVNTKLWLIVLVAFGMVSMFMNGTNSVITSMAPLYMRDKVNTGFLAGILDGFCYVGSTLSSYGLGVIADGYGWNGVFILLFALCGICFLVALFTHKKLGM